MVMDISCEFWLKGICREVVEVYMWGENLIKFVGFFIFFKNLEVKIR